MAFGEGRRVQDHQVVFALFHFHDVVFHVGHHARVLFLGIAVQLEVGLGAFDGFA